MTSVIITDLDETLYSWVDYFAPAFRGMVHALSREMAVSEDTLYDDFRTVYSTSGSLEYAFSVQDLESCKSLGAADVDRLVELARKVFARIRRKNLKCYPGVKETLEWAMHNRIPVIGVTNAPLFQAEQRLKQLYVDHLFTGLAGWEGHPVPPTRESTRDIIARQSEGKYRTRVPLKWALKESERKPSSDGYLKVMQHFLPESRKFYVVGDDLAKDIVPAMALGAIGVWASYGKSYKPENWDTLLRITHWSHAQVDEVGRVTPKTIPDVVIESFADLKNLVEPSQLRLWEW